MYENSTFAQMLGGIKHKRKSIYIYLLIPQPLYSKHISIHLKNRPFIDITKISPRRVIIIYSTAKLSA